jgi:hypothetical protein
LAPDPKERSVNRPVPLERHRAARLALAAAALAISGCGGGGDDGSGSSSATPATLDVHAAYRALTETGRVAALAGSTGDGTSAIGTLGVTPGQTALVTALGNVDVSAIALSTTTANASPQTAGATYWFVQNGADWVASFNADGSCSIPTSLTALPASATPGQSGKHIEANRYASCSSTSLPTAASHSIGTETENWSYEIDGGTPYFCIQTVSFGTFASSSTQICAEVIAADGTLGTPVRVKVTDLNGVTTTLTN